MDAVTHRRSTPRLLLLLVVVAGALTAGAILQRDRALEQAYEDAADRAELYAATVFRGSLTPEDVVGPIPDDRRQELFAEVQAFVLTDPAVARVRLWGLGGTLLFSTDSADVPGDVSRDPALDTAASIDTASRLAVEEVSPSTVANDPEPTPLFQTFVPVRLPGATESSGVAEVEQFASVLEARADDPWWPVQVGAAAATALLASIALVSVARGTRARGGEPAPARVRRRDRGSDVAVADLRRRLELASTRAKEAEESARAHASQLQQVSARLESVERQSPDERVRELREALRLSEAERAMLRAGRPETVYEAEVRQLRAELREARARAKAAETVSAAKGDLSAIQTELAASVREVERAAERARVAEGRAEAAEEQARATGEFAVVAEQRIDALEAKLQEVTGLNDGTAGTDEELSALRAQLALAAQRVEELEHRAAQAEAELASYEAPTGEFLSSLEQRLTAAEERATQAEDRLRVFEEQADEEAGSSFRHTLGVRAAGRKLAAPTPATTQPEVDPEDALRRAIARGLRGPLTRATGLTLSLQGTVESSEGKSVVRQLTSALRRMDQLSADLHDVQRILDGSLTVNRRRTDVAALLTTTLEDAAHLEDRFLRLDAESLEANVDPVRLRQVVEGMLEAAKERTRAGAAIVVRARAIEGGLLISVEDDNKMPASIGPEMSLASRLAELIGAELVAEGSSFRLVLEGGGGT
jgi:hypothetical protein